MLALCPTTRHLSVLLTFSLLLIPPHRESTTREGPSPEHLYSLARVAGVYLIKSCKNESLIYPLHLTQPYSPSAQCNVHNGSPAPNLKGQCHDIFDHFFGLKYST